MQLKRIVKLCFEKVTIQLLLTFYIHIFTKQNSFKTLLKTTVCFICCQGFVIEGTAAPFESKSQLRAKKYDKTELSQTLCRNCIMLEPNDICRKGNNYVPTNGKRVLEIIEEKTSFTSVTFRMMFLHAHEFLIIHKIAALKTTFTQCMPEQCTQKFHTSY